MRRMYSLEQLKVVSDERVKALVEGGSLSNAKPIYEHQITLRNDTTKAMVGLALYTNSPTQFTKSSFFAYITQNYARMANVNGSYYKNDKLIIVGYVYKSGTDNWCFYGVTTDGTMIVEPANAGTFDNLFSSSDTIFNDGVIKIN